MSSVLHYHNQTVCEGYVCHFGHLRISENALSGLQEIMQEKCGLNSRGVEIKAFFSSIKKNELTVCISNNLLWAVLEFCGGSLPLVDTVKYCSHSIIINLYSRTVCMFSPACKEVELYTKAITLTQPSHFVVMPILFRILKISSYHLCLETRAPLNHRALAPTSGENLHSKGHICVWHLQICSRKSRQA